MKPQSIIMLALMAAGGGVAWLGAIDESVSPSAVLELWGDVLRDGDQFGLSLTRLSDQEEMKLGKDLARGVLGQFSTVPAWEPYVTRVGQSLVPFLRRKGIQYEFHVLDSDQINA